MTLNGLPLAVIEGGQIRTVHADHLGTPQKMTDTAGQVVWDRVALPFGETHSLTGTASNPQRFPGQVYDPETGFHYNYFRDYDPATGRYVESDPIGFAGGDLNLYRYALGNPINLADPTGKVVKSKLLQKLLDILFGGGNDDDFPDVPLPPGEGEQPRPIDPNKDENVDEICRLTLETETMCLYTCRPEPGSRVPVELKITKPLVCPPQKCKDAIKKNDPDATRVY